MHAYAGRQFVPFLWWSLVWPGREANSRPTVREADTLPTEPTRHGQKKTNKKLSYLVSDDVETRYLKLLTVTKDQVLEIVMAEEAALHAQLASEVKVNHQAWFVILQLMISKPYTMEPLLWGHPFCIREMTFQ